MTPRLEASGAHGSGSESIVLAHPSSRLPRSESSIPIRLQQKYFSDLSLLLSDVIVAAPDPALLPCHLDSGKASSPPSAPIIWHPTSLPAHRLLRKSQVSHRASEAVSPVTAAFPPCDAYDHSLPLPAPRVPACTCFLLCFESVEFLLSCETCQQHGLLWEALSRHLCSSFEGPEQSNHTVFQNFPYCITLTGFFSTRGHSDSQ